MSALDAAYADLRERGAAADRAGDWQERSILEPLAGVADYVKRIGDHPDSAHYRADKSGGLLTCAVRVQDEVFWAYAGWPDDDTAVARRIAAATEVLHGVVDVVRTVLWRAAQATLDGTEPVVFTDQATEIRAAARRLARWADEFVATAVPDPEQEDR